MKGDKSVLLGIKGLKRLLTPVIHAVHDGHEALESLHALLLAALRQEVRTEAWQHALTKINKK